MSPTYVEAGQEYRRNMNYLPDRITRDSEKSPVEPGRYRLVAARACPWASRSIIVRPLLGLEDVISMGLCGPVDDEDSWTFDLDPDGVDPVLGHARDLHQTPGFGDNTVFDQIKRHYYVVQEDLSPSGIVPKGPREEWWLEPHDRDRV